MKTHELAKNLEAMAKLLRSLPNIQLADIDTVIEKIFEQPSEKIGSQKKIIKSDGRVLPEGIEFELEKMSPSMIEKYLNSETTPFSSSLLSELAARLGISISKRQNRNAIINMIAKHFEANQMDAMIKEARRD
jgi:hypothetical protein